MKLVTIKNLMLTENECDLLSETADLLDKIAEALKDDNLMLDGEVNVTFDDLNDTACFLYDLRNAADEEIEH